MIEKQLVHTMDPSDTQSGSAFRLFESNIGIHVNGAEVEIPAHQVNSAIRDFADNLLEAGDSHNILRGFNLVVLRQCLEDDTWLQESSEVAVKKEKTKEATEISVPFELKALVRQCAEHAIGMGFDPDASSIGASYGLGAPKDEDPNRMLHADGISLSTDEAVDAASIKRVRFVYTPDEGTLLYPDADGKITSEIVSNAIRNPNNPKVITEEEEAASVYFRYPRRGHIPENEELNVDAQQVRKGVIFAFDPTHDVWHQSPESDGTRFTVTIDVDTRMIDGSPAFPSYIR